MRRALHGLLLNTRRFLVSPSLPHHHHGIRRTLLAYEETMPGFKHHHHHHQLILLSALVQVQPDFGYHTHYHPSSPSKLTPYSFQWPRLCYTQSSADDSPRKLHADTHLATDTLSVSMYQAPIEPRVHNHAQVHRQGVLSNHEARKLLKLVKVEDFKNRLLSTGKHCIPLDEVLQLCKQMGSATTDAEAEEVAKSLDEAGFILIFRRKVFLAPEKVAEVLSKAMPLPLAEEDDPRNREYALLQKEKEEIDRIAYKQVRNTLWAAFCALSAQSMLFLRLTFWELSWDVMEPIAFFATSSSLLAGFFFFVVTKRDPSYHDFMHTLLSSKQRKLIKKRKFDIERFKELQVMCCLPSRQVPITGSNINHIC